MTILLLAVAYLVGSVPFGLLIGRLCGVDVRAAGSGNIGATNVWRICGWKAGLTSFLLDVLKGFGPTFLAQRLMPDAPWVHVATGVTALLGHTCSVWLGFKGGKGVATSLGLVLALVPVPAVIGFSMWAVLTRLSRYVSVGSLFGSLSCGIAAMLMPAPLAYRVATWLGIAIIWLRHRANMRRLLRGEEPKIGDKRSEPTPEEPAPAQEPVA